MTGNTADPATELVVWQGRADSTSTDHHGGGLAFGPDGKLYISTGDNGDPPTSQSLTSDHGKILRVNKDGTVPTDNPFFDGNGPNIDAIWARGPAKSLPLLLRRRHRTHVHRRCRTEPRRGGQRRVAGPTTAGPSARGRAALAGMTNPIFSYPHGGRDAAITGGSCTEAPNFHRSYHGAYFYGDFAQNWIRYLTLDGAGT